MSLLFFDIDGTLLLSGGAGVRAMTRAFEQVFGVAEAFDGILVAGHTDTYLLSQALKRVGIADTPAAHQTVRDAYHQVLRDEIVQPGTGRYGVMPGVVDLLSELQRRQSVHLALLTGNYEPAARIKLSHFGLSEYFAWGVFGDESHDRNVLARLAMTRARERSIPAEACARAVVIGDTPHDIACARASGARAVAVATGSYSLEQLRESGADVVFDDLRDTAAVLRDCGIR